MSRASQACAALQTEAEVLHISDLQQQTTHTSSEGMVIINDKAECLAPCDVELLNSDQKHAYDIVAWHVEEMIAGKKPPQLLIIIPGEGGVGKSKLIQMITQRFTARKVSEWLVKGAYTGIAASLIDRKTLHVLGGIPVKGGWQSAQTLKRLHEYWCNKRYLIIDEVSMLSRSFFSK